MRTAIAVLVVLSITLLILSGCGPKPQSATSSAPPMPVKAAPPAPAAPAGPAAEISVGERIFTTGIGADGKHVAFDKGSTMFKSKPGGCAPCHGEDGKGKKLPDGKQFPAIRFTDLCEAKDGKPAMYKADGLANPIIKGLDEKGEALGDNMPRWKLTDAELKALVGYLQELDTKAPVAAASETKALPTKAPAAGTPAFPAAKK